MADPSAWAGLGTLVLLEVVLGVDNLVFISILVGKLPHERRRQAFLTGLALALLMRMALLAFMARLVTLTTPLFSLGGHGFSARDLILMAGGVFLLLKGTMLVDECDLLVVVGARLGDRATGRLDSFCPKTGIIHIDIDACEVGKLRTPQVGITADAAQALRALLPLARHNDHQKWLERVWACKAEHGLHFDRTDEVCSPYGIIAHEDHRPVGRYELGKHGDVLSDHQPAG